MAGSMLLFSLRHIVVRAEWPVSGTLALSSKTINLSTDVIILRKMGNRVVLIANGLEVGIGGI